MIFNLTIINIFNENIAFNETTNYRLSKDDLINSLKAFILDSNIEIFDQCNINIGGYDNPIASFDISYLKNAINEKYFFLHTFQIMNNYLNKGYDIFFLNFIVKHARILNCNSIFTNPNDSHYDFYFANGFEYANDNRVFTRRII